MDAHAGLGQFSTFFWLRAELIAMYVALPAVLVGVSVWWATHRARLDAPAEPVRRARIGRLTGLGAGALVGLAVVAWCVLGSWRRGRPTELRRNPRPALG